jgi:hypothetical protein
VALSTGVFSADWHTHHRGALNSTMTARVKIERTVSTGKYNPDTGDYDGDTMNLLYVGRANIDRIANPRRRAVVGDYMDDQMTQVQLSDALNEIVPKPDTVRFLSGDQLTVLENIAMPSMVGEQLFLRGDFGASEDWAHTLHFGYNAKQGSA